MEKSGDSKMIKRNPGPSRREFLKVAAGVAAFTYVPRNVLGGAGNQAAGDKLNIAGIGVGGRGGGRSCHFTEIRPTAASPLKATIEKPSSM